MKMTKWGRLPKNQQELDAFVKLFQQRILAGELTEQEERRTTATIIRLRQKLL